MGQDIPRELAIKIDHLLEAISAGRIVPNVEYLIHAEKTLRAHDEGRRADRCVVLLKRLGVVLPRTFC